MKDFCRGLFQFQHDVRRKHLIGQLFWFLSWVAVTVVAAILSPSQHGHGTHQQLGLPACASVVMFGKPCPGCGMTTSWTATVHGQFGHAFEAHPLGSLLYLGFTASALICGYTFFKGIRWRTETRAHAVFLSIVLALFLTFGIWRFATQRMVYQEETKIWNRDKLDK
jgi:hypothetical protein